MPITGMRQRGSLASHVAKYIGLIAAVAMTYIGLNSLAYAADDTVEATEADAQLLRAGRIAFIRCRACHSLGEGEESKVGPNLFGFFGNAAASHEGFVYSDALRDANIEWTSDTLTAWIQNPADLVPGNIMAFAGIEDADEVQALITYLLAETQSTSN